MKKIILIAYALTCTASLYAGHSKELKLTSPEGVHEVMFRQEKISSSVNEIVYQVKYRGREVIGSSRAGLQLDNRTWELALARKINQVKCWMDNLEVDSVIYQPAVNKSWHPLYGERSTVREAYNEATMYLSKKDGSNYRLNIEVRAYDEGIAFRYFFPEHPQAIFHKVVGDLTAVMYSPVDIVTYYATPWKVIMAADKPGELLEHNDIIQNLNPPCEITDTDWIRPGKIMRETTITTEGAIATIDFCATHHIPYMLFDWQWYMPCTSHDGDATKVVSKLDMPRVITYGKEKGVGVWVYVNQHALMKQMRELFPLLHKWGVVGVKSGFVQYASHRWATWLHDMVRLAAENKLLINIHDEFRPSGFSRTYPNLLTQEGIRGNEEFPDATHNTILPFTRMINGAADYTICYFDKRLKNTHAHQLAASLIFYSPLQTIFWYDRPSFYQGEPEIEWFENLQTVFDDTKVLEGAPGKHITMARRKGNEWFVGALTNNEGSAQSVNLSFLDKGKTYLARIYTDGGDKIKTRTQVKCTRLLVDSSQIMQFALKPGGGAAIQLVPVTDQEIKEYKKYKGQVL